MSQFDILQENELAIRISQLIKFYFILSSLYDNFIKFQSAIVLRIIKKMLTI